MARLREEAVDIAGLHRLARVHHHSSIAHFGHHAEIVSDEQHGHRQVFAELNQQLEDLLLCRHVEGSGGLVGNDE